MLYINYIIIRRILIVYLIDQVKLIWTYDNRSCHQYVLTNVQLSEMEHWNWIRISFRVYFSHLQILMDDSVNVLWKMLAFINNTCTMTLRDIYVQISHTISYEKSCTETSFARRCTYMCHCHYGISQRLFTTRWRNSTKANQDLLSQESKRLYVFLNSASRRLGTSNPGRLAAHRSTRSKRRRRPTRSPTFNCQSRANDARSPTEAN